VKKGSASERLAYDSHLASQNRDLGATPQYCARTSASRRARTFSSPSAMTDRTRTPKHTGASCQLRSDCKKVVPANPRARYDSAPLACRQASVAHDAPGPSDRTATRIPRVARNATPLEPANARRLAVPMQASDPSGNGIGAGHPTQHRPSVPSEHPRPPSLARRS